MPNTLAHLGIQTLATRGLIRDAEVKWIWAGCLLPDLPWIGQRALGATGLVDPLDLRLYAMAQASLFVSLALAGALACLAARPGRVFAILAFGCLTHLLLDAAQIKWANGVHLFAPFFWNIWNFGFFWPEDWPTYALTALGAAVAAWAFWRRRETLADLVRPRGLRAAVFAALALGWLALPVAFLGPAGRSGSHHVDILRDPAARPGRAIGFDRDEVAFGAAGGPEIVAWTGERFAATGVLPPAPQTTPGGGSVPASLLGRFTDAATVEVAEVHVHAAGLRDYASYAGLAAVIGFWALALLRRPRRPAPPRSAPPRAGAGRG